MLSVIPGRAPGSSSFRGALFARTWNPEIARATSGFRPAPKRAHPGMTGMIYGGRSRAAIHARARYAASITASTPTIAMLPP
jgi:hypothetical protein